MANDLDDIIKINVIVFINFLKNFILKLDDLLTKYKCNIKNLKKPVNTKLLVLTHFQKIFIINLSGLFPKELGYYPSTIKRLSRR
jgi:hypothetical protein